MPVPDDLPWNTTRCNRLLRPLSSKLAKLRKEIERPRSSSGEDRKTSAIAFSLKASPRKVIAFSQPTRKPARGIEKRIDPDWMPLASTGAGKKTYGGRGARKAPSTQGAHATTGSDAQPGMIAFTPLIARTAGRVHESPQIQGSPTNRYSRYKGPLIARDDHLQECNKQLPSEVASLVKGLYGAYANLLHVTTTGEEKRWKGTRSLFGACLRKMPDYVALEEHFAQLDQNEEEEEDNKDVSQEVYMDLEERFEMLPGQGWRPLKQVVRAHATSLLCDAFADEILGLVPLRLLVMHCLNVGAWDEAEHLLWSFFPNVKPLPIPHQLSANLFNGIRFPYMWLVQQFESRTGRYRVLYELLANMITHDLLPLEWLATEHMRPIWDRLVRILSDGDSTTLESAFNFLETAICAGAGIVDKGDVLEGNDESVIMQVSKPSTRAEFREALNNTFSSFWRVFSTIAVVNRHKEESTALRITERVTSMLDSIVMNILDRRDINNHLAHPTPLEDCLQLFAQRSVWALFASFLVHLEGCNAGLSAISLNAATFGNAISWFLSQYPPEYVEVSNVLATLPAFTSAVARGTGRIWGDNGFNQIQRFVQSTISLSGVRLPHKLWTMKRIALESAMDFAERTNDPKNMAYAREIEASMRRKGQLVIAPTPSKNDSPSATLGFRWEEGIGEWVACTPFPRQLVRRIPQKPVPNLQLLPTPQSSRGCSMDGNTQLQGADSPRFETWSDGDDEDEGAECVLPSSPVKGTARRSTSGLGQRKRASSPMVLIPAKRREIAHADTPIPYFSENEDLEGEEAGPRRSRRSRKEIRAVISGLRTRSSLDNSLRNIQRKTYDEREDSDADVSRSSEEENGGFDLDTSILSTAITRHPGQSEDAGKSRARRRESSLDECVDGGDDEVGVKLVKNPKMKRRRSTRRTISGLREWWKVDAE